MKKIIALVMVWALGASLAFAQKCTLYIPNKVGTELHYQMKNGKGKLEGTYIQKVISIRESGGKTSVEMLQTFMDPKSPKKIMMQDTIRFHCKDNVFYIDMEKYMNKEQMEAFEGMEIKVTTEDLMYPPKLSPGQALKDGSIKMEIETGVMNMTISTLINNRKVEGQETITTPAGNFKCSKISEDIQSKTGFMNMTLHNVVWIMKDVGTVRSETYDQKGKLNGITELVKIVK